MDMPLAAIKDIELKGNYLPDVKQSFVEVTDVDGYDEGRLLSKMKASYRQAAGSKPANSLLIVSLQKGFFADVKYALSEETILLFFLIFNCEP